MAGLFNALNAARTSLETNQKSLEVVGNNISNVNTEGYSRQYTTLTPYPSVNFGDFFIGQGVKVTDVQRDHDVFIQNQLVAKSADFGYQNAQSRPLSELERILTITDDNLASDVDNFFDSWQELSANPSDLVLRDIVIQRGELLSTNFNNTIDELNTVQENINDTLVSKVDEVNSKITEIAELNERISNIEINGQSANTARDRRESLAQDLAESVGAQSYYDSKGMMTVQLPGGLPLVQANSAMSLSAVTTGSQLDIKLNAGGVTRTLNSNNIGGEFEGLLYLRDSFITDLEDDLDRLAYEITVQVNTQHSAGAGLDSVSGRNFFTDPPNIAAAPPTDPWLDAARGMSVAITEAEEVAASQAPPAPGPPTELIAPGDNRNALILANLDETFLIDGIDNFNSFYGKMTATVGLETNQNSLSLQGAEDAVVQLENLRDSLAGVSLEEEMIDLITFQRGFESSAKFLTTVDEMMDTLIQIKR
jgi:flagellar hook-associated protein 1 FlgK